MRMYNVKFYILDGEISMLTVPHRKVFDNVLPLEQLDCGELIPYKDKIVPLHGCLFSFVGEYVVSVKASTPQKAYEQGYLAYKSADKGKVVVRDYAFSVIDCDGNSCWV